jgi:hypothetical protein
LTGGVPPRKTREMSLQLLVKAYELTGGILEAAEGKRQLAEPETELNSIARLSVRTASPKRALDLVDAGSVVE